MTTMVVKQIPTPTKSFTTILTLIMQTTKMTENHELSTHSLRPLEKSTLPQRNVTLKPMQLMDRLP